VKRAKNESTIIREQLTEQVGQRSPKNVFKHIK